MNNKIKLIVFDMEGTIFRKQYRGYTEGNLAPSIWPVIAIKLGEKAHIDEKATVEKWLKGSYKGYVEWVEATVEVYKKHGLTKDIFEDILSGVEYYSGVKEAFEELRKKGYRTALVSGGFKAQADRAQRDLKINHAFTACDLLWDEKGRLVHCNSLPCDYEGKLDFIGLIMKEHGLKHDECAFVGDGKNDIPLAKAFEYSVCFNGAEELQKVSKFSINQPEGKEDFRAILEYF